MSRTIVLSQDGAEGAGQTAALPRDLRFRLARVGPWSVFKLSLFFATGALLLVLGALGILYVLLDAAGVLASIEKAVNQYGIIRHFQFDAGWIFTRLAWIGLLMVVLGSLVATCMAWFYNAVADATGGLDVRLEPFEGEVQPARMDARHVRRRAPRKVMRMSATILGLPPGDSRPEPMDRASGF